jgi:hypothetical protein
MGCTVDLVVRPFRLTLDRGPDELTSLLEGQVDGASFVFVIDGARYPLPTVRLGTDDRGQFAVVEESEQEATLGFRITVEIDSDEDHPDGPYGCRITRFKPHPELEAMQAANPWANVAVSPDSSVSVYFGPTGRVNGWSGGSTDWSGGPVAG